MSQQNVKILLTVFTEGGSLVRKGVETKTFIKDKGFWRNNNVMDPKSWVHTGTEKVTVNIPVTEPQRVMRKIKLTRESFEYFISSNSCPTKFLEKKWKEMTRGQRVNAHCKNIALSYGSNDYEFSVLED